MVVLAVPWSCFFPSRKPTMTTRLNLFNFPCDDFEILWMHHCKSSQSRNFGERVQDLALIGIGPSEEFLKFWLAHVMLECNYSVFDVILKLVYVCLIHHDPDKTDINVRFF